MSQVINNEIKQLIRHRPYVISTICLFTVNATMVEPLISDSSRKSTSRTVTFPPMKSFLSISLDLKCGRRRDCYLRPPGSGYFLLLSWHVIRHSATPRPANFHCDCGNQHYDALHYRYWRFSWHVNQLLAHTAASKILLVFQSQRTKRRRFMWSLFRHVIRRSGFRLRSGQTTLDR